MSSLGDDSALESESLDGIRFITGLSVFVLFIAGVNLAGLQLSRLPPGATSRPFAPHSGPAASA